MTSAPNKVFVLGSSGMLGQQVSRVFDRGGVSTTSVSRSGSGGVMFDYTGQEAEEVMTALGVSEGDWVINCIGWIPQKATGSHLQDALEANMLNVSLPSVLEQLALSHNVRVLQVLTDCVFSGSRGSYSESDVQDSIDLYGTTKSRGEAIQQSAMRVRASIIGPDLNSQSGLMSWFLGQKGKGQVTGFDNHMWNGVSTLAMAKLFMGVVKYDAFEPSLHHWIPVGTMSKFEILEAMSELSPSHFPRVVKGLADKDSDRTLATLEARENERLWQIAGYEAVPSIRHLLKEMIDDYVVNWLAR